MKNEIRPILKWVGGKRNLYDEIHKRFPQTFNTYVEPFFGGGGILFNLLPKKAIINDINSELMNVYNVIKNDWTSLVNNLSSYSNTKEQFYEMRSLDRDKSVYANLAPHQKAARIIYLNKTCYNGLYRVNMQGELNSPFGRYKNPNICDKKLIQNISNYFNSNDIKMYNLDFDCLLQEIQMGDFVYLDPPYDPISDSSSFTGYTSSGFNRAEQERLKTFCDKLHAKGAYFLLSNSNTSFIKNLYKQYKIEIIKASRFINCKGDKRKKIDEVLIRNY